MGMLLFSTFSCSEDFLKPEPLSFFAPENIYVDKAGFEALLVNMRKSLVTEYTGDLDLMLHQWNVTDVGVPLLQLDMTQLTPSSDRYMKYVSQINTMYEFIKNANVAISRIDDIEWKNPEDRNVILAEALWHRAYWYYRLVHNYGDVPWVGEEVTKPRLDFNTYSRWAILKKIQSDLESSVNDLPETAIPGAVTKGAGNHLLTKIYLANLEFDKAIETASRVINGSYSLMKNRFGVDASDPIRNVIWDLHRPKNKNAPTNTENILSIVDRFEAPEAAKSVGLYTMRAYHPSWWYSNQRDSEGNRGMIDEGPMYDTLGRGDPDCVLTEWFTYDIWSEYGATWETTTDLRRSNITWMDIEEFRYNNPASVNYGEPWNISWVTGDPYQILFYMFACPIYKTMVPQQDPAALPMGGNGDWYVFRLAGTYLLRAEAYYWKGDLASAAADINMVRERASATPVQASDVTIDYIFDERARELFDESPRQNEMVRVSYIMARQGLNGYSEETISENSWYYDRIIKNNYFYPQYEGNKNKTYLGFDVPIGEKFLVIGHSPKFQPHHILWPIDDKLITANTQGTINQNKGYDGAERNKPPIEIIE